MLGKTHLAAGIALTAILVKPSTPCEILETLTAASLGSVFCDLDLNAGRYCRDATTAKLAAAAIAVGAMLTDLFARTGIIQGILESSAARLMFGFAGLLLTVICAVFSRHRCFSHSFLAVAMLCLSVQAICPGMVPYILIASLSHVALDLLNKKPVQLLFPVRRGFCFHWCASDGGIDKLVMALSSLYIVFYAVQWIARQA